MTADRIHIVHTLWLTFKLNALEQAQRKRRFITKSQTICLLGSDNRDCVRHFTWHIHLNNWCACALELVSRRCRRLCAPFQCCSTIDQLCLKLFQWHSCVCSKLAMCIRISSNQVQSVSGPITAGLFADCATINNSIYFQLLLSITIGFDILIVLDKHLFVLVLWSLITQRQTNERTTERPHRALKTVESTTSNTTITGDRKVTKHLFGSTQSSECSRLCWCCCCLMCKTHGVYISHEQLAHICPHIMAPTCNVSTPNELCCYYNSVVCA